jgi:hypothetical protein
VEIERFREPQFCDACKATLGPLVTVEKVATWKLDGTMMYLPIRPYGVIDAINRVALATGGVRGAMAGSHADYNGHSTQVSFNDRRQYWVAEYTWAGRNVLARGEFESCVQAAKHEWDRGALGAAAQVKCLMDVQVEYCRSLGFVSQEEYDAANASWRNEYLDRVAAALRMDKLGFKEGGTADLIAEAKAAGVLLSAGR